MKKITFLLIAIISIINYGYAQRKVTFPPSPCGSIGGVELTRYDVYKQSTGAVDMTFDFNIIGGNSESKVSGIISIKHGSSSNWINYNININDNNTKTITTFSENIEYKYQVHVNLNTNSLPISCPTGYYITAEEYQFPPCSEGTLNANTSISEDSIGTFDIYGMLYGEETALKSLNTKIIDEETDEIVYNSNNINNFEFDFNNLLSAGETKCYILKIKAGITVPNATYISGGPFYLSHPYWCPPIEKELKICVKKAPLMCDFTPEIKYAPYTKNTPIDYPNPNNGTNLIFRDITEIPTGWTVIDREWTFSGNPNVLFDSEDNLYVRADYSGIDPGSYENHNVNLEITATDGTDICVINKPFNYQVKNYERCQPPLDPSDVGYESNPTFEVNDAETQVTFSFDPLPSLAVGEIRWAIGNDSDDYIPTQYYTYGLNDQGRVELTVDFNEVGFHHKDFIDLLIFVQPEKGSATKCNQYVWLGFIKIDGEYQWWTEDSLTDSRLVNTATSSSIFFSPNPADDILNISIQDYSILEKSSSIEIYDIMNRKVKSISNIKEDKLSFDVSDLRSGMYILKVISNNQAIQTEKIMIK